MIQVRNIAYKVREKYLLRETSIDFAPGTLNLIVGPNGAGKSTLLKLIAGQMKGGEGMVLYNKRPLHEYSVSEQARFRAVLSQNLEVSFPLSVYEIVMMGRYAHFNATPESKDKSACEEVMAFFEINDLAGRDYTTLSGGEKQRVQFARVLAQIWYPAPENYRYLLLDEPLTFLDVHYQHEFMQQLKVLLRSKDLVVIAVVHDLNLAVKYADNVTLLYEGEILANGTPNEILTIDNVKKAYGIEPKMILVEEKKYLIF